MLPTRTHPLNEPPLMVPALDRALDRLTNALDPPGVGTVIRPGVLTREVRGELTQRRELLRWELALIENGVRYGDPMPELAIARRLTQWMGGYPQFQRSDPAQIAMFLKEAVKVLKPFPEWIVERTLQKGLRLIERDPDFAPSAAVLAEAVELVMRPWLQEYARIVRVLEAKERIDPPAETPEHRAAVVAKALRGLKSQPAATAEPDLFSPSVQE